MDKRRNAAAAAPPPEPNFAPGAGWHCVEGFRIPGSTSDLLDRRTRAWRGWVLPMRLRGERLSGAALQNCVPIEGGLLMMPMADRWCVHLFVWPEMAVEQLSLVNARLVRTRGGVRQYQGLERERSVPRWPQTWLCAPTREVLAQITQRMADQEWV